MTSENLIDDIPLPGMPEPEALWAVHIQGPDDIVAEVSREVADSNAKGLNDWYEARTKDDDYDPATFPRVHAEVIPWPFDREAHAESLKRQAAESR